MNNLLAAGKHVDVQDGVISLLASLDACLWRKDKSLFVAKVSLYLIL